MTKRFSQLVVLTAFCLLFASVAGAQVASVGTLTGTISDATGAVIAGADIKVKDDATSAIIETKSGADGSFTVASLRPGNYSVTVSISGFKTGEFRNLKITVGQISNLSASLEIGEMQSTVVVEAGAEVLETASTTIGTTITGKAITTLPLSSRDALDLAILMPGAATTGRARQTSFLGLPKGAINITMDGINAQDNLLKSSDGFFTIIRPRVDSMEEFSIATAGQGADQSSEGAVQIRFETKRGSNEYHGGGWWQHRNDFFNANYFFSNQKAPGAQETPRQRQRLNQFGGQVGGPIIKEKAFFFVAMDNYRNPNSQVRTRTILAPLGLTGRFEYRVGTTLPTIAASNTWTTCGPSARGASGTGNTCVVDLFAMGAALGTPLLADSFIASVLSEVDSSRAVAGVNLLTIPDAHTDSIQFNNPGDATRRFPDVRLDYNPAKAHQISFIYHYNYFVSTPDFLNNRDRTFPAGRFNTNEGVQISNRNQWTASWRYNLAANKSNELRVGLQTAPVSFSPNLDQSIYPVASTNQGSAIIRPSLPIITQPFQALTPSQRNTSLAQLIETFSWTRSKHSFTFGGSWTEIRAVAGNSRVSHTATLGLSTSDPASAMFSNTGSAPSLPGASATQLTNARNLFGMLAGRVSAYSGTVSANVASRAYVSGADAVRKVQQTEFGFYGQDQWRLLPNLTVNYGLRWEYQGPSNDPDNLSYRVAGQIDAAYGISGAGNLFMPGTLSGSFPLYELNGTANWYNKDMNNWAPNLGLAWTPGLDNKFYNMLFGGPGKTVLRANYSVTFTREGVNNFNSIAQANPGFNGTIFANPAAPPAGACPATFSTAGTFAAGCLTLNNLTAGSALQSLITNPLAFPDANSFPILPFSGQAVNVFDRDLAIPLVHNWSFGIQREINPNLVVEVRYVGNHGQGLWRQDDLNEVNIFENGFLQEYLNARNNLAICTAATTVVAGVPTGPCITAQTNAGLTAGNRSGSSFANWGLPGQVPLPILTAAFTGTANVALAAGCATAATAALNQCNSNFRSGTFLTPLGNGTVGSMAHLLQFGSSGAFICNMAGAPAFAPPGGLSACPTGAPAVGLFPANFFVVNPHAGSNTPITGSTTATGGSFRFYNGTHTTYNGLQIEARHRPANGLQFSTNYTWSKSLTNNYADSSASFAGFNTMRNPSRDKGISPWDLRHQFKLQLIYELPFGAGKRWSSGSGWANQVIGGWEVSAIQRWQSGRVFLLQGGQGGTFNQYDPGVELVGITAQQIQSMLEIRKTPDGNVFYFPASLIGSGGTANSAFIRPCATPGAVCQRTFLYGPSFYRADISVIKNFKVGERLTFQYRAEFLNAFNNINFFFPGDETTSVPTTSVSGTSFGRVTNAFRDVSTTDDNGGRIIQMVFRINF